MSVEEFARIHPLAPTRFELRHQCNRIVERPDFWYRKELRDSARKLAVKASDILTAVINGGIRK